jgi:hypothetical protein
MSMPEQDRAPLDAFAGQIETQEPVRLSDAIREWLESLEREAEPGE